MNDPIDDQDDSSSSPPKPRKLPQQSRSKMLVSSVQEACLKILKEKGPRGLTATEISEISGVAMGSIYQYFPNVDAIVATVYEALIEQDVKIALEKQSALRHQMTLRDSLIAVIKGTLWFHRRMLKLDRDFHQRFYQTFDIQHWFNRVSGDPQASSRAFYDILVAHSDEVKLTNPEMQAFVLTMAHRGVILDAVKYRPEYLQSTEFADYILHLSYGVLGLPIESAGSTETPGERPG
jgi:AcrR family transcriptional regulator